MSKYVCGEGAVQSCLRNGEVVFEVKGRIETRLRAPLTKAESLRFTSSAATSPRAPVPVPTGGVVLSWTQYLLLGEVYLWSVTVIKHQGVNRWGRGDPVGVFARLG